MTRAILGAVARASGRDLRSFGSLTVNNFSLFVALMIYGATQSGVAPKSSYPFLLLLGFLLLFPLSGDPLAKIPANRLAFWPLEWRDRAVLRMAILALSPVVWFTLFLLFRAAPSLALFFGALAVGMQAALAASRRVLPPEPWVPPLPVLVRKDLRQMLTMLDPYLALIVSAGGTIYRFAAPAPDPTARPVFAILVGLALSTYAQCLFSLDSASGLTRYGLLPLPAWRILLAKDAAWLALLAVLVLPLDAGTGLTYGVTVLAIGHWPSVRGRLPLKRWRFAGGRVFWGCAQVVTGTALAMAEHQHGALFLLAGCAGLGISLAARNRIMTAR